MDQRIIQILSDSFTQLLIPGICVTIPLTLISFAIGLVVAVAIALIRTAKTPVLEPLGAHQLPGPLRQPSVIIGRPASAGRFDKGRNTAKGLQLQVH